MIKFFWLKIATPVTVYRWGMLKVFILSEFMEHFLVRNFIFQPLQLYTFEAKHRNSSPLLPVVPHPRYRPAQTTLWKLVSQVLTSLELPPNK